MMRRGMLWPAVGAGLAIGLLGLGVASFTVDDAFVVARYAEHLRSGAGYAMNPGHPTDGVTGPLWLFSIMALGGLGLPPIGAAKLTGLAFMAIAAARATFFAGVRSRRLLGAAFAAILMIAQSTLFVWGVGGLETGLATWLLTEAALAGEDRARPRGVAAGLCLFAIAWLRPELALAAVVILVRIAVRDRTAGKSALALAAAGALSVLSFRLLAFGHAFPLSASAKPSEIGHGIEYAALSVLVTTGGLGLYFAGRGAKCARLWPLFFLVVAHAAALMLAGGDWMPGYRLYAPVVPIQCALIAMGIVSLRQPSNPSDARGDPQRWWLARGPMWTLMMAVALIGVLAIPVLDALIGWERARSFAVTEALRLEVADALIGYETVAMVDVGLLAYRSGVKVLDLGGITDPVVAHAGGGYLAKRIPERYVRTRAPDALLLHSDKRPSVIGGQLASFRGFPVETRLLAIDWVEERFAPVRVFTVAPDYHYVLFERER